MKKRHLLLPALCAMVLGFTGLSGPAPAIAAPVVIRFAHRNPPSHLTKLLFHKKNLLKHYGKSYTVKLIFAPSSSSQIPMLAAKQIDIAWLAYASFASSIVNANLDLRIVSDLLQYGAPGYFSGWWSVMKTSNIRTLKDFKGKRIAVNALGTALDMSLRVALRKVNLEADRDYTRVEVRFPNMYAMLSQGKVDAAVVIPPWFYMPKIAKKIRPIFTPAEGMGRVQALMNVARTAFLKKNHEAFKDFSEDYLRALRWWLNPKNREEALDITARVTKRPRKNYARYSFRKGTDYYHDPNGLVNEAALQRNINTMHELGYLKRKLDTKPYVDMSYMKEAARRLGAN
ncbi:MAG: ABC transporter substrate-binding protein [Nitrospinota bacterium]